MAGNEKGGGWHVNGLLGESKIRHLEKRNLWREEEIELKLGLTKFLFLYHVKIIKRRFYKNILSSVFLK